jgi:hypothetical protein
MSSGLGIWDLLQNFRQKLSLKKKLSLALLLITLSFCAIHCTYHKTYCGFLAIPYRLDCGDRSYSPMACARMR